MGSNGEKSQKVRDVFEIELTLLHYTAAVVRINAHLQLILRNIRLLCRGPFINGAQTWEGILAGLSIQHNREAPTTNLLQNKQVSYTSRLSAANILMMKVAVFSRGAVRHILNTTAPLRWRTRLAILSLRKNGSWYLHKHISYCEGMDIAIKASTIFCT